MHEAARQRENTHGRAVIGLRTPGRRKQRALVDGEQSHLAAVAVGVLALLAHLLSEEVVVALESSLVAQLHARCGASTSHSQCHVSKLWWKRSLDQPLVLGGGLRLALTPRTEARVQWTRYSTIQREAMHAVCAGPIWAAWQLICCVGCKCACIRHLHSGGLWHEWLKGRIGWQAECSVVVC